MNKQQKTFLPVIHTKSKNQVIENTRIALENGADGVFLVNHGHNTTKELLDIFYPAAKEIAGDKFIGINDLTKHSTPESLFKEQSLKQVDGVWVDNPFIGTLGHVDKSQIIQNLQDVLGRQGLYFGGVNFKHQKQLNDLEIEQLHNRLVECLDVIVTSGPSTGFAAQPLVTRNFANKFPTKPVAIASGITPDNLSEFLDHIDIFMVATGISYDFHHLDPKKVKILSQNIKKHKNIDFYI